MKRTNALRHGIKSIPIIYPLLASIRKYTYLMYDNMISLIRTRSAKIFGLVNAPKTFRTFCPSGVVNHNLLSDLTVLSVNQTFPFLATLVKAVTSVEKETLSVNEFCIALEDRREAITELKHKLDNLYWKSSKPHIAKRILDNIKDSDFRKTLTCA